MGNINQIALGEWKDSLEGIFFKLQPSISTCLLPGGWTLHWIPKWCVWVTMNSTPLNTRSLQRKENVYGLTTS